MRVTPGHLLVGVALVMIVLVITWMIALQISVMLWGGMELAMPTAMPLDPFTSRLGNFPGSTVGSSSRSS